MNLQDLDIIRLKQFQDDRGILLPIEFADLPFIPNRLFMVSHIGTFNPEQKVRGKHANKMCQQYFYCLSGEVQVSLFDGIGKKKFTLTAGQGLFIDKMIWNQYLVKSAMGNTNIYIVLASHPYDANDYITDLEEFKKLVTNEKK